VKKTPISEETRVAILNAAWKLVAETRSLDVSQSKIAEAAGVSRQTVYLAFGSRAGLLTEMARNMDQQSDHVARLVAAAQSAASGPTEFQRYLEIWLDYLPMIYPVGILLDAAALTDPEAAAAWNDRMKHSLLAGLKRVLAGLDARGETAPGIGPDEAAELIWSLVHPATWRLLVVECGWTPERFRQSRMEIIRSTVFRSHTL